MMLKFCIVSVLLGSSVTFAFFKGKPLVNITRFYPCEEFENKVIIAGGNVTSYNETMQLVSGFFSFTKPFDKSYKVRVIISRFIDSKWHKDFHLDKDDPCNSLRMMLGPVYAQILERAHVGRCPIQPGTYSLTDFPVDARTIPLIYATGFFKFDLYFLKTRKNEMKFCYRGDATITLE